MFLHSSLFGSARKSMISPQAVPSQRCKQTPHRVSVRTPHKSVHGAPRLGKGRTQIATFRPGYGASKSNAVTFRLAFIENQSPCTKSGGSMFQSLMSHQIFRSPSSPADIRAEPCGDHFSVTAAPVCAVTFLSSRARVGEDMEKKRTVPSVQLLAIYVS